jgi:DNA sulfur modification protein DndD
MKILKLKLENFRVYYGEQEIEFSTDTKRNLTLCLAKNNGGKTTLAQSITWCLYGHTELKEPDEILNKDIKLSMNINESRRAGVTLHILHRGNKYIIRREQIITRLNTGYKSSKSNQTISVLDENNILVDATEDIEIKEFLPRSLSRFFIFDGERMLHMGSNNNIHRGEMKKDIESILGLDALEEAINHLGGWNSTGGVLLSLTKKVDNGNDDRISKLQTDIETLSNSITSLDSEMKNCEVSLNDKKIELAEVAKFLKANETIKQKQEERDMLKTDVNTLESKLEKHKNTILKKFSNSFPELLIQRYFSKSIEFITDASDLREAAPDVTSNTIDYILEKGECICGTTFNNNDNVYLVLDSNRKYYPPESLGTITKRYLDQLSGTSKANEEVRAAINDLNGDYLEIHEEISSKVKKLEAISRDFQESTEEAIRKAEQKYSNTELTIKKLNETIIISKVRKKQKETELQTKEKELTQLSQTDSKNQRIMNYYDHTKEILTLFRDTYKREEEKIREKLQKEVQEVYSTINRGKGKLEINEKFDFLMHTLINGKMIRDDSKGQGLSTVAAFAFVCGISKLVRERMGDEEFYRNEPYPLIIDAPYSVMDKDYIKRVSEVLPEYAEQLIILVKDDNFETARKVFEKNDIIGAEYIIQLEQNEDGSENQFKTSITKQSEAGVI